MKKITKVTTTLIMAVILCFTVLVLPACMTTAAEETQNNVSENAEITSSGETGSVESEEPVSSEVPPVSSEAEASEPSEEQTGGDTGSEVQSNVSSEPVEPVKPVEPTKPEEPESTVRPVSPEVFEAPERPDQTAKLMPNIAFDGTPIVSSTKVYEDDWEMDEYGENSPYNLFDGDYSTLWQSEMYGLGDKDEWFGLKWDEIKNIELVVIAWDDAGYQYQEGEYSIEILDEKGEWKNAEFKTNRLMKNGSLDIITFNGIINTDGIRVIYHNSIPNENKRTSTSADEMEVYEDSEYFVDEGFYVIDGALERCIIAPSTVVLPEGIKSIKQDAFEISNGIESVVLPESLEKIDAYAFNDLYIEEIYIPEGVTDIAPLAFYGCISLKKITVDPDNAVYSDIDGVLFSKDGTELISYPGRKSILSAYKVPEGTLILGEDSFACVYYLRAVELPDGLVEIRDGAFKWNSIEEIRIPKSVEKIGKDSFFACEPTTVYYDGSGEDWANISISDDAKYVLEKAEIQYNCGNGQISFSYADTLATYEGRTENIKREGFVDVKDHWDYVKAFGCVKEGILAVAEKECTFEYDSADIAVDFEEKVVRVRFSSSADLSLAETVYLHQDQYIVLVVYGE